jgi:hypothetical protein
MSELIHTWTLMKGKSFPIGTIRQWKGKSYKKSGNGKWEEVKKQSEQTKQNESKNNKYKMHTIARPIKDVGLQYGDKLPDNVILHGSKQNNKEFEIDDTKTFYGTTDWSIADNYVKGDESAIVVISIDPSAKILDLSTDIGRKKLAEILGNENGWDKEEKDKAENDFETLSLHVLGISDSVDYANALYENNVDGIKDTSGNYDITNNSCLKSYIPETKPSKKTNDIIKSFTLFHRWNIGKHCGL